MSGHGVLVLGCSTCGRAEDDVDEVQGEHLCRWCRDRLPTCEACGAPMRESLPVEGDESGLLRVCDPRCGARIQDDIGCQRCKRIPADPNDVRQVTRWNRDDRTWDESYVCTTCVPG